MRHFNLIALGIIITLFSFSCSNHSQHFSIQIKGVVDSAYKSANHYTIFIRGIRYELSGVSLFRTYKFALVKGDELFKPVNTDTLHVIHEGDEAFMFVLQ